MQAAIIHRPGQLPVCGEFPEPTATEGAEIITVTASALSHFSKSRSSGAHYSSASAFPLIAGIDGTGRTADGRRVYFALPQAPFGALSEKTLVRSRQCIPIPDSLDEITAAAIANPGMSAWVALVERARLAAGETVLVHGATSTAGRIAIQLAKFLGAGQVIATGRNQVELEQLLQLGADRIIPIPPSDPNHENAFEAALIPHFAQGIDIVIDYLWGQSAQAILTAIVRGVEDARPVRFIHVGAAAGEQNIALASTALRSSAIQLMGSGVKSVPFPTLLHSIAKVFESVLPAGLQIATKTLPLASITTAWQAPAKPRIVITPA